MTEEKPVHEQVQDLLNRWNPPATEHGMERLIGATPEPGDGRATVAIDPDPNQGTYTDDGDDPDEGDDDGDDEGDNYEDLNKDDLKAALAERDLPTSGTKDELIARLREDDDSEE